MTLVEELRRTLEMKLSVPNRIGLQKALDRRIDEILAKLQD